MHHPPSSLSRADQSTKFNFCLTLLTILTASSPSPSLPSSEVSGQPNQPININICHDHPSLPRLLPFGVGTLQNASGCVAYTTAIRRVRKRKKKGFSSQLCTSRVCINPTINEAATRSLMTECRRRVDMSDMYMRDQIPQELCYTVHYTVR